MTLVPRPRHERPPRLPDWAARCPRCRMHVERCLCASLPTVATRTRLVLVVHTFELWKTTNTGVLATRCLPNSELVVVGRTGEAPPDDLTGAARAVVLFPDDAAVPLAELADGGPLTLVVPDGNWRQAKKARTRVPALAALPAVRLPSEVATTYRLRTSSSTDKLATLEAIAHALGVLEGPQVRDALLAVFDEMVRRTLVARGQPARAGIVVDAAEKRAARIARRAARRGTAADAPPLGVDG